MLHANGWVQRGPPRWANASCHRQAHAHPHHRRTAWSASMLSSLFHSAGPIMPVMSDSSAGTSLSGRGCVPSSGAPIWLLGGGALPVSQPSHVCCCFGACCCRITSAERARAARSLACAMRLNSRITASSRVASREQTVDSAAARAAAAPSVGNVPATDGCTPPAAVAAAPPALPGGRFPAGAPDVRACSNNR